MEYSFEKSGTKCIELCQQPCIPLLCWVLYLRSVVEVADDVVVVFWFENRRSFINREAPAYQIITALGPTRFDSPPD